MSKYHRNYKGVSLDVYVVLDLWKVTNPATQHAIKKLLMPGQRGSKGLIQDLKEARQSIDRAIQLEEEAPKTPHQEPVKSAVPDSVAIHWHSSPYAKGIDKDTAEKHLNVLNAFLKHNHNPNVGLVVTNRITVYPTTACLLDSTLRSNSNLYDWGWYEA